MYDYYKTLPEKEFPNTVTEMQLLFSAVAHGCAAGLHQQALTDIYWPRIRRCEENYVCDKLGVSSDDLAAVANFFTTPWHTPAAGLTEVLQITVLAWAGLGLRALGRLREALEPMQRSSDYEVKHERWLYATEAANNLSELQLALGYVAAAVVSGKQSVGYADQSEVEFRRIVKLTTYAYALHQAGETAQALERFIETEQLLQELQPEYPRLYSLQGFQYCDLLLAKNEVVAVLERAEYDLDLWTNRFTSGGLLNFSLPKLTLGRAYYQRGDFLQATNWLDLAVTGLRESGRQDFLPLGLFARAALHRDTRNPNPNHDFVRAHQDLQEVYDIAEPNGMRLHMTDYHLEMARLLIAEQQDPTQSSVEKGDSAEDSPQKHIAKAAKLIKETGYKRRLPELQALQKQVAG